LAVRQPDGVLGPRRDLARRSIRRFWRERLDGRSRGRRRCPLGAGGCDRLRTGAAFGGSRWATPGQARQAGDDEPGRSNQPCHERPPKSYRGPHPPSLRFPAGCDEYRLHPTASQRSVKHGRLVVIVNHVGVPTFARPRVFPSHSAGSPAPAAACQDAVFLFVFALNSWGSLEERLRSSLRDFHQRLPGLSWGQRHVFSSNADPRTDSPRP
jgi:hypothetical protein